MADYNSPEIQSFLDYLKFEKRYSAHTIISYQTDITAFFLYLHENFGKQPISEITHSFIRSWLADLKEKKLSSRSITRKISTLRSFFKYHLKRGAIKAVPTANLVAPKISRRLPVFAKERETQQLLTTLNTSTEDWKTLNARMLVSLFYATGMRVSELINLKERQLDPTRLQIRVLGKGNKERIIPVSKEVLQSIKEYLQLKKKTFENSEDVLLVTERGKKLYPKYAWLLVNKYLGQASTLDKKSPHVLRHTFATHLLNNGAELNAVKELLGHASLAATQVYTHNTIEKLKDVHKKAHPKS
ncbi:MAG: tyrosine-type recombinase/integrase [Gloeobacteraceae cyanobacterium ES-bin-316]|nr:tyrosine-type recombinase/integrase [Ferruginibacter sp.]